MRSTADMEAPIADSARRLAPVVWLLGKVQSGKTSIVRALTQATDAEIGTGFRACTKTARVFDFPAEAPIIRFLDTRGLGEAAYDPAEDLAFCESRSHLILAVVKALDPEQRAVLDAIAAVRARHPEWPVVVAQTSLHEGYTAGARSRVLPYPFGVEEPTGVPDSLVRALAHQRDLFNALPRRGAVSFVPIDFTAAGDGFEPQDYGREELIGALIAAAPTAVALALAGLPDASAAGTARRADSYTLGFALAAGASDAVPVAGVVAVPAVQAAMLHQLGKLYGIEWDRQAYMEFGGALGAGALVRTASSFGIRQLVKLIPVYGQTAGAAAAAAASFATTYAMGKAASYYLGARQRGVEAKEVSAVYAKALREAFVLAKARETGAGKQAGTR